MRLVKFGDVVKEVKVNIDRTNNPYDFYVAGDHMDSEDLTIRRKGRFATDDVGPAFTRLFKPGQILYGSRRTYLKKVAVADFEGICSNTTFVLETKDESVLRQRLLPFIMLTDDFTKWSISKSKGSTNPYILFSDLANYEFELPDITHQDELVELLWQAYATKESYKEMIQATDEMVKSQFIEMFGGKNYPKQTIGSLCKILAGKTLPLDIENEGGPIAYLKVADMNLPENDRVITTSSRSVSEDTAKISGILPEGATVFPKNGAAALHNKKRITSIKTCVDMNTMGVYTTSDQLDSEFLYAFFVQQDVAALTLTGAIPQIRPKDIAVMEIPLPALGKQKDYIAVVQQADKSKFELKQAIEKIDKVMRALMQ